MFGIYAHTNVYYFGNAVFELARFKIFDCVAEFGEVYDALYRFAVYACVIFVYVNVDHFAERIVFYGYGNVFNDVDFDILCREIAVIDFCGILSCYIEVITRYGVVGVEFQSFLFAVRPG